MFGGQAAPQQPDTPAPPIPAHDTKWLQDALNKLGASPKLAIDGVVSPVLRTAIADYQRKNGLDADGLVGPATIRALEAGLAAPPAIVLPPPGAKPPPGLAPTFWGRVADLFRPKKA